MIRGDFHMHTEFSTDSEASVRSMLDSAVERGLLTVCVTDHLDKDYPPDEELGPDPFQLELDRYFDMLTGLREEYRGELDIRIGVELGMQPHLGAVYEELVANYPFDFVIGSLHLIHGMDPYYGRIFEGRSDQEVYREAFRETLDCLDRIHSFDVLGHLDYVVRYGRHQALEYSYRKFADEIDEILRPLIRQGRGLEMNMGGLKYGLGFANPHPDVLKRYRELGGEIVTIGSDAHRPEHIAYDFEQAGDILKMCGFRYYAEFSQRKPDFRPIP
nr:histidinol-phosphatase HisJ family protein [uncultured Mediterraneibacter sp.]